MAIHLDHSFENKQARHAEIARRYAWQAQQRRTRCDAKPAPTRLLTLIRLRELERLFVRRYGRFLPDDDAGRDDLEIAAHHVAFLRGEVIEHIVAWARAWAPWMPLDEAKILATQVAAAPQKFTADTLAWRLRLSMADRTTLKITTIGAFDVSRAERETERKRRKREAERARRAKQSNGRPRGRPRKNAWPAGYTIADHGFSPDKGDAARVLPMTGPGAAASKENQISTSRAARPSGFGEGRAALPPSADPRAALSQQSVSSQPPPEVVAEAAEIAREHGSNRSDLISEREARRLFTLFWPRYVADQRRVIPRYYGRQFDPKRDLRSWECGFKNVLDREYTARERFRERRRKWDRKRASVGRRPILKVDKGPACVGARGG
jgi:hypothetical protein